MSTTMPPALITRSASTRPSTANDTERTVELVIATSDPVDGLALDCSASAVSWSASPVPVLMDHTNTTGAMAGRLEAIRATGREVVALARFTDAPAAEAGWQLARAGCAVSVGAAVDWNSVQRMGSGEIARRWRLAEASLTPVGADPAATTRSMTATLSKPSTSPTKTAAEAPTMTQATQTTQTHEATSTVADEHRSAAAVRLERDLLRMAHAGQLTDDQTQQLLTCRTATDGAVMVTRLVRQRIEAAAPVVAGGSPLVDRAANTSHDLQETLYRALSGKETLPVPLWRMVVGAGLADGRAPVEIIRRALFPDRAALLTRAHSTSDLPNLLTAAGDRALMERFQLAPMGVMALATVRALSDFRPASVIDLGTVGNAEKMLEGGEVKYGSITEAANSYRAHRYSLGLKFTAEAIANDDLSGLEQAIAEMGDACLSAEADLLTELLEGAANGATAADGLALFAAGHANTTTASGVSVATFGEAVEKLRTQKSIAGRHITQAPALVLCAPDLETSLRSFLSDAWQPTTFDATQPWRGITLEVEPRLSGSYYYVVSDSARRPLQLGRQTAGPVMTSETDFDTDSYKTKVVHSFGGVVAEHRTIIRVPAS